MKVGDIVHHRYYDTHICGTVFGFWDGETAHVLWDDGGLSSHNTRRLVLVPPLEALARASGEVSDLSQA